jgi:cytochrome d ubiquinol oxidase subunit II
LSLKTTGDLNERVTRLAGRLGWLAAGVTIGFVVWSHATLGGGFVPNPLDALAVLSVIAAAWAAEAGYQGWTFAAASLGMAGVMGSLLFDLAPRVFVSSTNTADNLTIANSAAGSYSLQVMTVVAAVFFPLVLAYQGWTFHVFRARLQSPPDTATSEGDETTPRPAPVET